MQVKKNIDFERIAEAIDYMYSNSHIQFDWSEVASYVNLNSYHFQQMFQNWAGISPKKFLQYLNANRAKSLLPDVQLSFFDTADKAGFSVTRRLHNLFVKIERMTPDEYKNGGKNLKICYSFSFSTFGEMLIASTEKGICFLAFSNDKTQMFCEMNTIFPQAELKEAKNELIERAILFFDECAEKPPEIRLHLKATDFQLKVWETLLKIPEGKLSTYGDIAEKIQNPKASRAVGSAIGNNPVSYFIPCHRVIRSNGVLGQYHWGATRKKAMIGWEAARVNK